MPPPRPGALDEGGGPASNEEPARGHSGAEQPVPVMHIALLHAEIGPNAGNAGRLCLAIGARLHLVHPLGFSTSEKAVRRAGLDYWKHVDVMEHPDDDAFWTWTRGRRVHCYSARGTRPYTAAPVSRGDVLVFGRESVGLPKEVTDRFPTWRIPMPGPTRSLNLSNAIAVVAYDALARVEPALFEETDFEETDFEEMGAPPQRRQSGPEVPGDG